MSFFLEVGVPVVNSAYSGYLRDAQRLDFRVAYLEAGIGASQVRWYHRVILPFVRAVRREEDGYMFILKSLFGRVFVIHCERIQMGKR